MRRPRFSRYDGEWTVWERTVEVQRAGLDFRWLSYAVVAGIWAGILFNFWKIVAPLMEYCNVNTLNAGTCTFPDKGWAINAIMLTLLFIYRSGVMRGHGKTPSFR